MFDAVSIAPEAGVTIRRPAETVTGADFTPLPERFQETRTGVPEFKPPSITEAPIYGEPSIASSAVPSGGKDDYLEQLTDEIKQMAQRQGLDPDKPITGENPAAELPPNKIRMGQRIKIFFDRIWTWLRRGRVNSK